MKTNENSIEDSVFKMSYLAVRYFHNKKNEEDIEPMGKKSVFAYRVALEC